MTLLHSSIGKKALIVIFTVSISLFTIFGSVLYHQFDTINQVNRWSLQQYDILRALRVVLTDLLNTETGLRGYLLTAQPVFLQPYDDALQHLHPDLDELQHASKTAINNDISKAVDQITKDAIEFQDLLNADEQLVRKGGKAAVSDDIIAMQKDHMDRLRAEIEDVVGSTRHHLSIRLAEAQQLSHAFVYTLILGTVFSIGALLFSTVIIVSFADRARRAGEAVRESEQRFLTVMNGVNDGLFDFDAIKKTIYYSPSYRAMLGYNEIEYPNTLDAFQSMLHPDDILKTMEVSRRYREREIPVYANTFRLRHKDGSWRWILSRGIGMWDEQGQMTRLVGTHTDITEQKQRESELQQLNIELESFTYIASHDLRSPLVNLKGFAGEMEHALKQALPIIKNVQPSLPESDQAILTTSLEHDIPEALGFIKKSVEKMDLLITAVLDLSRLGKREYNFTTVDSQQIAQRCLDSLAYEITQKRIEVVCHPLPTLVTDAIIFEQIFGNVLENAVKYLKADRPGRIVIDAKNHIDDVIFSIADNGRGIANADEPKVFEIFRRARNTGDVRGLGMGMAFVKASLRKMNGSIWFQSKVDEGTTFYFQLPRKQI